MTDKPLASRIVSRCVHTPSRMIRQALWRPVFATFGPALNPAGNVVSFSVDKPEYAVVLTSCNRFDLLKKTVASLIENLDVTPAQFIVVEDSGDEGVRDVLSGFDVPFEIIVNRNRLGQAASIDKAYAAGSGSAGVSLRGRLVVFSSRVYS